MAGGDGEGATEFNNCEGGGIGEGEGTKDVSDKIENEDQVMTGILTNNFNLSFTYRHLMLHLMVFIAVAMRCG